MKKKIGFVAIGQAGGNIGQLLEADGYSVLYINTSKEDLGTLKNVKFTHHIAGGEGCNKNRSKAKQLVVDDFDNIASQIDKLNAEIILTVFSAGGGTGSGAGPMLTDLLVDDGRTVGVITILPSDNESVKAQINCYQCLKELTSISGTGATFVIDNKSGDKMELNKDFVRAFTKMVTIPDRHSDVRGNVDKAEVVETLKANGMAVVVSGLSKSAAEVIEKINNSIFAPIETDSTVKYITSSSFNTVNVSDIQKAFGKPIDVFQTYNNEESTICLSGLSFPQTRIDEIGAAVEADTDNIKRINATKEVAFKDFNIISDDSITKVIKVAPAKPKSRRDILNKYL